MTTTGITIDSAQIVAARTTFEIGDTRMRKPNGRKLVHANIIAMKQIRRWASNFYHSPTWKILIASYLIAIIGGLSWFLVDQYAVQRVLVAQVSDSQAVVTQLSQVAEEFEKLKADDQVVKNASLSAEVANIQQTYSEGAKLFEDRADLVVAVGKVSSVDIALAKYLRLLGDRDWTGALEQAKVVRSEIDKIVIASTPKVPVVANAPASNAAPGSGYARQKVSTERGEFVVSIVVAPGARAIIETAGDSDCSDNCLTKSLAEHISASGGFAGINGAYFCPPDYAQCQGKVNSFDTLAVNGRTKAVLNRANNVYSTVPLVAAYGTSLSFYDQTVQWGVDTSSGGAIANYPRLVRDGAVATTQENGKGTRGFIGMKDGAIVIGHVFAASFADSAEVLKVLGLQNAMNLDGGGSSALWSDGGYKVGPGRSLPTAIVLVR